MPDASPLAAYLSEHGAEADAGFVAYLASLEKVHNVLPDAARSIVQEFADQRGNLKMIASENYCSLPTQLAMGNLLTDKYAEGIPDHRFYAGCDNVDAIESKAAQLACDLFCAQHAYVQPHSGADANMVAFWAILSGRIQDPMLKKMDVKSPFDLTDAQWKEIRESLGNQRLLGLDLSSGGHLTHGYKVNVSGRMFESHSSYGQQEERTPRLRRDSRSGQGGQAAHPDCRLQCLPAQGQLPHLQGNRGRGRRSLHGRHGTLRRSGGRQGLRG